MENIAEQLYPDFEDTWGIYDYTPIIKYFGEVLLRKDIGHYQGDTLILYKHDDGSYSFLAFGWGSCSGCDALLSCKTLEEVNDLIENLDNKRIIRSSAKEMLDYFENKDWESEWYWYEDKAKLTIKNMKEILKEEFDNE